MYSFIHSFMPLTFNHSSIIRNTTLTMLVMLTILSILIVLIKLITLNDHAN